MLSMICFYTPTECLLLVFLKRVNNPYELQTAIQDRMSVTTESRDFLSYEISPYKDSDDEDGDEDHMRKKKCFPSWAR